jgi:CheY-like chemotaxis protein
MDHQSLYVSHSCIHGARNGSGLILSVDDEPAILLTRQKILEAAGHQVRSASDGEQAMRLFSNEPVDLVLLDYVMPGADGGRIAQAMKRSKEAVPIVLVSASTVPEEAATWVDYRLEKGQGPQLLLETIAQFLLPTSPRNNE